LLEQAGFGARIVDAGAALWEALDDLFHYFLKNRVPLRRGPSFLNKPIEKQ
jgi:hypothetical protein